MARNQERSDGQLLILGGSGMLGGRLLKLLGSRKAIATYCSSPLDGGIQFDATRNRLRESVLPAYPGIKAALILFGITKLDICARDPIGSTRVNVDGVKKVIDDLVDAGIKPVFASSDAVFDGSRGMWTESDAPNPILTYGMQKLEVERYMSGMACPWVIVRLAKILSDSESERNLLSEWSRQIESGEAIVCATDARFSPVDSRDAAQAVALLAGNEHSGIYHVGGPSPLTRIDLLMRLIDSVRQYRDVSPNIVRCSLADIRFEERRPVDLSMSSQKLRESLGIALRDPESICAEFAQRRFDNQSISIQTGTGEPG